MTDLLKIIVATGTVAMLAWAGIVTFALHEKAFDKVIFYLVAFAAGTLIGAAFFHLIPESLHELGGGHGNVTAPLLIIGGFVFFFILEQYLNWHHCHRSPGEHPKAPVSYMVLIANGIHNVIDGILVGAAFIISTPMGVATTIAVAAHELPQELGNYGILVYGGWDRMKALIVNFGVSLLIIPGGILAYMTAGHIDPIYIVPVAAGGFIYIGAADLIPEIHSCGKAPRSIAALGVFLLGIGATLSVELFLHH